MRKYVLTSREKEIIREYVDTGKRLEGFRLMKSLIAKLDTSEIEGDLELIKAFKKKL